MKNYDNNDNHKSLEREFAERIELLGYSEAYDELIALITTAQRTELMGDPNAIVTFMEGVAISSLVKGDIYKLVQTVFGRTTEQVSELLTKEIKYLEMQRTIDVLISIDKKLKEAEIDPQKVNLHKILIPAFQAISIEDNPAIQEMYMNLLASAIAGEKVDVDDIKILNTLSGNDVLILEAIYTSHQDFCRIHDLMYITELSKEEYEASIERLTAKALIYSTTLEQADLSVKIELSNIGRDRGASEYIKPGDLMLDLDIIEKSFQNAFKRIIDAQTMSKYDFIKFTTSGQTFLRKCKGIITKSIETEQNP